MERTQGLGQVLVQEQGLVLSASISTSAYWGSLENTKTKLYKMTYKE